MTICGKRRWFNLLGWERRWFFFFWRTHNSCCPHTSKPPPVLPHDLAGTVCLWESRCFPSDGPALIHFDCYRLRSFAPVVVERGGPAVGGLKSFLGCPAAGTVCGLRRPNGWYRDYESCM